MDNVLHIPSNAHSETNGFGPIISEILNINFPQDPEVWIFHALENQSLLD